jgi:hypothetical protein
VGEVMKRFDYGYNGVFASNGYHISQSSSSALDGGLVAGQEYSPAWLRQNGVTEAMVPPGFKPIYSALGEFTGFEIDPDNPRPQGSDPELCFLSDTKILTLALKPVEKDIQNIISSDLIAAYDFEGNIYPGRVTAVFRNSVFHILDFHGTGVTPGHAYFCAGGKFAGHHVPIMDILRTDGAVMRADGSLMRASTGEDVGSEEDRLLEVFTGDKLSDGSFVVSTSGTLRAGMRVRLQDGREFKLLDLIIANGGRVTADGLIQPSDGSDPTPLHWTFTESLPKPEDYILARSAVTLEEIYAAGEWEAIGTRMASPEGAQPTQGRPKPNIPPAFADRPDVPKHRVRERSSASKLQ